MKVAVISDTHFGDQHSQLAKNTYIEKFIEVIKNKTGKLDYLVLNGDILDFSISSFENAFNAAKQFFLEIQKQENKITEQIIYIPGNHDKHIWDAIEWEVNVIQRLRKHELPREFKRVQLGFIDLAQNKDLFLPGIKYSNEEKKRYGGLFLEGLFENENTKLPINVVYPNLYIRTNKHIYIITHGHMLDMPWVLLSELLDGWSHINVCNIRHFEEYNYILTSLICTGIGQGGDVSKSLYDIILKIRSDNKNNKDEGKKQLNKMLSHMMKELKSSTKLPSYLQCEKINSFVINKIVEYFVDKYSYPRGQRNYYEDILNDPYKKERYMKFFIKSRKEVREWENSSQASYRLIFGHTHVPISNYKFIKNNNYAINIYNTGGWLLENSSDNKSECMFAKVFFIENEEENTEKEELSEENIYFK